MTHRLLHPQSIYLMLVHCRRDTVSYFETSSYILQCAAKAAGLAPVLLWSRSKEKSNSRNESYVCWYREHYLTCWSTADRGCMQKCVCLLRCEYMHCLPLFTWMLLFPVFIQACLKGWHISSLKLWIPQIPSKHTASNPQLYTARASE